MTTPSRIPTRAEARVERRMTKRYGAPLWLFLFLLVCAALAPLIGAGAFLADSFGKLERARNLDRVQEKAHTMALAMDRDLARNADIAAIWPDPPSRVAGHDGGAYDLPRGWFAAIVDPDGTIRARSFRARDFIGSKASAAFVRGLEQSAGVSETTDLEGRPSVTGFFRSPQTGWTAAVWVPRADLDAPSRQMTDVALGISASGVLLSLAASWLAATLISRPTRRAVEAARRLGVGQVPPVEPTGLREIDLLSGSLHRAGVEINAREEALKASTARANGIIDSIMDGFMVLDSDWRITFLSARGYEILHRPAGGLIGANLWEAFPDLIGSSLETPFRQAAAGQTMVSLETFYPALGRWLDVRAYPSPDGLSMLFLDITARKQDEARQRLLMRELDHRAKNVLAVVQSVVNLTHADTMDGFVTAVRGRVAALARTHALLADNRWEGADLLSLVSEELAPYQRDRTPVAISGPTVYILPEHVQSVGMIVHELATNAAKYGALSTVEGRVDIRWEWFPNRTLQFTWRESGGPVVEMPEDSGFGSKLICRTVESQLHGNVTFHWNPDGLVCEITLAGDFLTRPDQTPTD